VGWREEVKEVSKKLRREGSEHTHLQRSELDERFNGLGERLSALRDLLSSSTESRQSEACGSVVARELSLLFYHLEQRARPKQNSPPFPPSALLINGSKVGKMTPLTFSCLVCTLNVASVMLS
jgi:hypothetical protein